MNIIGSEIVSSSEDLFWHEPEFEFENSGSKRVLIVVSACEPGSQEDRQLTKMLEACKLDKSQYNVVRLAGGLRTAWYRLRVQLQPRVVFLIGVLPEQLGVSAYFKLNEPNHFNDCLWLPSLSLAELDQHAQAKTQLWTNGMKPVFVDKKYGEFS